MGSQALKAHCGTRACGSCVNLNRPTAPRLGLVIVPSEAATGPKSESCVVARNVFGIIAFPANVR